MAVIQAMKVTSNMFGGLARYLLTKIIKMAALSIAKRVDFVGDRYPAYSIKELERQKRRSNGSVLKKFTVINSVFLVNGKSFCPMERTKKSF